MARRSVNPFGTSSPGGNKLPLEQMAAQIGVAPTTQPSAFEVIIDLLNKPSELTEKFLTGERGYEGALEDFGVKNTKGQLDLNDILSFSGKMVLDPLNLIAPLGVGTKLLKGAGAAAKVAGKIKPIGKAAKVAEELFVPFSKVKRVSPQLAEELPALETMTRAKQTQAVRKVGELGKEIPKELRPVIGKLVERMGRGETLSPEEASAVTKVTGFIQKGITEPERAAGLLPKEVANYFPRKADRDAVENLLKFGGKKLSLSLGGAEKARKFDTQEAGEAAGVIYRDALEALAIRASKSEAARANSQYIARLVGGEVKDIDGKPLFRTHKKGKELLPGYTGARIDSQGIRIGDRFLGFYPTVGAKGEKIVGVVPRAANFQVPTEIADELAKYFKAFTSDDATNSLLKFYDDSLGMWKASVTSLFPAFHVRNAIGNLSNMWLGGFKNPKYLVDATRIQRGEDIAVKGTTVTRDMLEQLGITGKGRFGHDIPKVLNKTLGKAKISEKLNPFAIGQGAGSLVEDNAKTAFFLDRLAKGDSVPQAVAQVKKYLFDYSALTPFEKTIMKRIFPFYTWMRNNVPLQIEALITQPGKQAFFAKSFANLVPLSEEDKSALPAYLREQLTAKIGETPEGETEFLSNIGLPIEDLGRLSRGSVGRTVERDVLGSMGPLGNILGLATDKDFYRGEPISESGYRYGRLAKDFPQPIKDFLEFREEKSKKGKPYYYVDPLKYQQLTLFGSRIFATMRQPSAAVLPGKITPISLEEEKEKRQREQEQALQKLLEEKGLLKKFESYYVPKQGGGFGGVK